MEVLRVVDVKKYFGGVRALDGVSFTISKGEIVAIVGPNGAGKTTLINTISGYIMPDHGRIVFMGNDVTKLSPIERIRLGIARSFQFANIFDNMTVYENILAAVVSRKGYTKKLLDVVDAFEDATSEAEEIIELFGLEDVAYSYPTEISYGDRKLVDVAIAFALDPKLLLMDEPTSGVATKEKDVIMQKITTAIRRKGVTSIIVEHDMDIVFRYTDRMIVMHQGKVLAQGKPDEILRNEEIKKVFMG
jgi:branched-chain amino acid transport system ATP-binding protein